MTSNLFMVTLLREFIKKYILLQHIKENYSSLWHRRQDLKIAQILELRLEHRYLSPSLLLGSMIMKFLWTSVIYLSWCLKSFLASFVSQACYKKQTFIYVHLLSIELLNILWVIKHPLQTNQRACRKWHMESNTGIPRRCYGGLVPDYHNKGSHTYFLVSQHI